MNTVKEITQRNGAVRFSSLILLECPLLATPKESGEEKVKKWAKETGPMIYRLLSDKQDVWPSKSAALDSLRKTMLYKKWDARVMELHIVSNPYLSSKIT